MKTASRSFITAFALAVLLSGSAVGAEMRWNGNANAAWTDPTQWQVLVSGVWRVTPVIPGPADQADLPGAGLPSVSIIGAQAVGALVVSGSVALTGGGTLTVNTTLTDNHLGGTLTSPDSTAIILGSSATGSIYALALPVTNQGTLVTAMVNQSMTVAFNNLGTVSGGYLDTDIFPPAGGINGVYGLKMNGAMNTGTIHAMSLDSAHNVLTAITFNAGSALAIATDAGCSASACSYTGTTISGAGTLTCQGATFIGANTIAAPTTVTDVLTLNGSGAALTIGATGTGTLTTVGATNLMGSGTITGTVLAKGALAIYPGQSDVIGTLAITGNLTLARSSSVHCDISTSDPAHFDQLTIGGSFIIPANIPVDFCYNTIGSIPIPLGTTWPFITANTHAQAFSDIIWDDPDTNNASTQLALAWNGTVLSAKAISGDLPPVIPAQSFTFPADAAGHNATVAVADGMGIPGRVILLSIVSPPAQSQVRIVDTALQTLVITPQPGATGSDTLVVSATDYYRTTSVTIPIAYTAPPAPTFTGTGTASGNVALPFSFQIPARNGPTGYTASPLPPGLTLDTTTGLITGTPTDTGTYAMTVTATNVTGTRTTTITITIMVTPPVITSALTATTPGLTDFSYQIAATGAPTSYSATSLPSGLTLNATSGAITGQATDLGIYNIVLGATNPGGTGHATLVLTVTSIPIGTATATSGGTAGSSATTGIPISGGGGGGKGGGCGLGAGGMLGTFLFFLLRRRRDRA